MLLFNLLKGGETMSQGRARNLYFDYSESNMLEQLLIFTRGGLILWTCKHFSHALRGSPIDALIRSCLLEERSGAASFSYDAPGASYSLKWTFHNDLGLVFVAVYQRILHLLYVDDLLAAVKRHFSRLYHPRKTAYRDFDDIFTQLHIEAEARAENFKKPNPVPAVASHRKHDATWQGQGLNSGSQKKSEGDSEKGRKLENDRFVNRSNLKSSSSSGVNIIGKENESSNVGAFDVNRLQKLKGKGGKGNGKKKDGVIVAKAEPKKVVKKNRVWDDSAPQTKLDFTDHVDGDRNVDFLAKEQGESMMDKEEILSSDSEVDDNNDDDDDTGKGSKPEAKKKGWFSSMFQSIAGKANLDKSDLEPTLKALKDRLMTKNVAEEIAEKLCESVAASLEGKKLASFTRISSTVHAAMEEALVRILTPRRSIDILRDVHAAKEQRKPYVVVFVGVNGVGKSTNLAKVAYWLLQHNISVMMAACDTFRSGAVEQLRTHARRLQIPIFEKGYEKDPAIVAKEAIQEASRNGSDVVLVDTAGRMQDNEPLMRALSKLVYLNNPDLILFVGEALVGNDAVDQLSKFNQKLADLSTSPTTRLIDGILLTKFDTIDDKVGAALSMVYVSGAPVMFVGCGQSYTDLKKLNVKSIAKTLLK
ncbi:Signal recognition particle receptor subunit alpha, partial [Mucuna pruriens]